MKVTGSCVVSGEPCFVVTETYPLSHVLAGQPRKFGPPLDDACRVTLVLVDGTLADITVKQRYVPELYVHLAQVWRDIKARTRFDRKHHKAYGQPDFNDEQHAKMDAWNLAFNDNVPLGVLAWRKWKDVINGD